MEYNVVEFRIHKVFERLYQYLPPPLIQHIIILQSNIASINKHLSFRVPQKNY